MKVELRDYQAEALDQARGHLRAGARSVLINAPTGSGKTVIASALMELTAAKQHRANFVVDRLSLIGQTSATFDRYGLEHGVIQSAHPRYRPSLPIQICSIQTLGRRGWPQADIDVFDEAHVLHSAHKARIEQRASIVVGLTATPFTRGLGKWFDAVVNVTTTRKLIEAEWLVPYRAFSCAAPDMTGIAIKAGEYDEKESSSRALKVVGDVVAEYLQHGEGKKFICSAVDVRHVEELQRQFLAAGVNAARFTYREDEAEREDVTAEFRKPDSTIRGLITVTAASRGFDVPDVSCVIMARPLRRSLAEHIQLLGRGLRISDGKSDCLVLDHSNNMRRFWEDCEAFFDEGIDELDDGKPREKPKPKPKPELEPMKCPACALLHRPLPFCPGCGHEYPRRQSVQHVPGTLTELLASGSPDALRAKLWPQVVGYVLPGARGDMERAQRKAQAIYRELTGAFARGRVENTVPILPTRELRNRIVSNSIRWAKGRESVAGGSDVSDFRLALEAAGLHPRHVDADGRWHRCPTVDKPRRRNGAYCLAIDGLRGWWRNWATDLGISEWHGDDVRTAARRAVDELRLQHQRDAERARRRHAIAAARAFWAKCKPLVAPHPYLADKGLSALGCTGLRVHGDLLVVPVLVDRALVSIQTITSAGEKRFWTGAPVRGGAYTLLRPRSALLCVVEGLATGLAVFQAVRQASVVVAFDAGNLLPVVDRMRPTGTVVIAADNDHRTAARSGINPGIEKARNAAELIGCGIAAPSCIEGSDWADALKEWGACAPRRIEREILAGARFVMGAG